MDDQQEELNDVSTSEERPQLSLNRLEEQAGTVSFKSIKNWFFTKKYRQFYRSILNSNDQFSKGIYVQYAKSWY